MHVETSFVRNLGDLIVSGQARRTAASVLISPEAAVPQRVRVGARSYAWPSKSHLNRPPDTASPGLAMQ
jgi:hypothetical protein